VEHEQLFNKEMLKQPINAGCWGHLRSLLVGWFGCTIGSVNIVTGSRSDNAFGGNIGGGLTYRLGERTKFYTEVRYHHASYDKVATDILPLTFGIRW
jgi:hypothetical protein